MKIVACIGVHKHESLLNRKRRCFLVTGPATSMQARLSKPRSLEAVSVGALLPSPALVRLVVLAHAQPSRLSIQSLLSGAGIHSLPF